MNNNNNVGAGGCQKSLDTICEAIRHLEGDKFMTTSSHIEEEVITDPTYAIQDQSQQYVMQVKLTFI